MRILTMCSPRYKLRFSIDSCHDRQSQNSFTQLVNFHFFFSKCPFSGQLSQLDKVMVTKSTRARASIVLLRYELIPCRTLVRSSKTKLHYILILTLSFEKFGFGFNNMASDIEAVHMTIAEVDIIILRNTV